MQRPAIPDWPQLVASQEPATALAFAVGRQVGAVLRRMVRIGPVPVLGAQLLLGVYGGYFGGAVGIMMMAVWNLLSTADLLIAAARETGKLDELA